MFCGNCGEKLNEGIKFCVKCGNPVNGTGRTQAPEQPQVNDAITQNAYEDQETVISQVDVIYATSKLFPTTAFGPMIITDKRLIMSPQFADGNGHESKISEMEVAWKDISNVQYSAMTGTSIHFHYITKNGKEHDQILVSPWSGLVESVDGAPVYVLNGKIRKALYETIHSAWSKGR